MMFHYRRPVAAALLALASAGTAAAQQPCPFRLVAHPTDEAMCRAADPALAATWALARELLGEPRAAVPEMLVHVYADREAFAAAAHAQGGPDPRVFPGFANFATRSAHLFVGPDALRHGALTSPTKDGIVHETMHLATQAIGGRGFLFEKRWYVEGLAMWAEQKLHDGSLAAGAPAGYDLQELASAVRARTLLRDGRVQRVDRILLGDNGDLSEVDEYCVHRALFDLLMEAHGEAMRRLLATTPDLPSSPELPQRQRDLLRAGLGEKSWKDLDAALQQRILAAAEKAAEAAFEPPVDLHGAPDDDDFHPGSPLIAWAGKHERSAMAMTARVTLRHAGCDQADFVFGQEVDSWLRVCLVPGRVLLLARSQRGDQAGGWEVLARSKHVEAVAVGTAFELGVEATSGSLVVKIDGRTVVRAAIGKRSIRGRWGMGAPAGCRASWKELRLR